MEATRDAQSSATWRGWPRYLWLSLFLLPLLLGIAWAAFSTSRLLHETLQRVAMLQEALQEVGVLQQQAVDLESGERGFLLTDDREFLGCYEQAEKDIPAQFLRIDALLASQPDLRSDLAAVQDSLAAKRGRIAATLALYHTQGREPALAVFRSEIGRQTMDDIRAALSRLGFALRDRIDAEQHRLQGVVSARSATSYTALGLAFVTGLASILLLRRHLITLREEEALRRTAENANRASREKSSFLANMSHEIRTPMNAIFGFSQLLAERATDPQEKRYIDAIQSSGRALLTLINDVLDISRIEAGKLEIRPAPMSVRETVDGMLAMFAQLAAEKGLMLSAQLDATVPEGLELDAARLRQILFNLIGNAVKYTDRGSVTVHAAARLDGDEETRVRLVIEIIDTGPGIDAADQERIFEPFTQLHREGVPRQGTGLGLAITRRIARMMGGDVAVTSRRGEGSCFTLNLPEVPLALPPVEAIAPARQLDDLPPCTVLVADDIALNRQLIEAMLRGTPLRVLCAASGTEAVELARLHCPAVVLMDIRMPGMDGLAALERIRAEPALAETRVVAVTASSLLGEETRLRERFDGYVRKPITREVLFAELARVVPQAGRPPGEAQLAHPDALPEVLDSLHRIERTRWPELTASLAVRDTSRLAAELQALAERCGSSTLEAYALRLWHAAESFDPQMLEITLAELPERIAELERQRRPEQASA